MHKFKIYKAWCENFLQIFVKNIMILNQYTVIFSVCIYKYKCECKYKNTMLKIKTEI